MPKVTSIHQSVKKPTLLLLLPKFTTSQSVLFKSSTVPTVVKLAHNTLITVKFVPPIDPTHHIVDVFQDTIKKLEMIYVWNVNHVLTNVTPVTVPTTIV